MNAKTSTKTLTRTNAAKKNAQRKARTPKEQKLIADFVEAKPADTTPLGFTFSPYGKTLLNRAILNVRENDGKNLPDPAGRAEIMARAGLLEDTGGDLSIAILAIAETGGNVRQQAGMIYSLCNAVMKAAMFHGNLDLRRWLDPRDGEEITQARGGVYDAEGQRRFSPDQREEHRDAPCGLEGSEHAVSDKVSPDSNRTYVPGALEAFDATCLNALRDINVFLGTTVEAFGWESNNGMPFLTVRDEQTGAFHNFYDVEVALDEMEKQRQKRLIKMRAQRTEQMSAARIKARALVVAAMKAALAPV